MTHTKEPWAASETRVYLGRDGGFDLRNAPAPYENARRIVACVNACSGVGTETLELMAKHDAKPLQANAEQCLAMVDDIKQQRDELLAMLRYVMDDDGMIPRASSSCRNVVAAAIAKVEAA